MRRLLWGPERVWLLSRLSLRRRVLSGSVCSRCFAADVQPVLDLQTLLLAVAGEALTAGGVIRLVDAAPLALHAPRMLDCMYAQQILLLAWPPRPHGCPAVMGRECVSAWGLRLIFSSTASTSCRCALGNVRQQQPQPQIQHSYGTAVQYMHVCTQYAKHCVARVLSRDSLRRYTSVHLRRPRCCRDW